jgi:hypothetical protein
MLPVINWPEEAIKPLSIVDTNKARSHKRGTHISNPFCSVLFCSLSSRSRWRESQLPPVTHCAVHRLLSFLVMLTLENTGSAAHSPLATRHSPPYSSSKSQRSLPNLASSHWVDEESKKHPCVNRNNEVCLVGDRRRGWTTGSQPFFRSCGGDRSSRGIVRTSAQ